MSRWEGEKTAEPDPALAVLPIGRDGGAVYVSCPREIAQPGESAMLVLLAAPDLGMLLGYDATPGMGRWPHESTPADAPAFAAAVLVRQEGSERFDMAAPARLERHPLRLLHTDLPAPPDGEALCLYQHPVLIDGDAWSSFEAYAPTGGWQEAARLEGLGAGGLAKGQLTSAGVFAWLRMPAEPNAGGSSDAGGSEEDAGLVGGSGSASGDDDANGSDADAETGAEAGAFEPVLLSEPCSNTVYVDFCATASGDGSEASPVGSLAEAVNNVCEGGTIVLTSGVSSTSITLDKPVRIEGNGVLGAPGDEFLCRCATYVGINLRVSGPLAAWEDDEVTLDPPPPIERINSDEGIRHDLEFPTRHENEDYWPDNTAFKTWSRTVYYPPGMEVTVSVPVSGHATLYKWHGGVALRDDAANPLTFEVPGGADEVDLYARLFQREIAFEWYTDNSGSVNIPDKTVESMEVVPGEGVERIWEDKLDFLNPYTGEIMYTRTLRGYRGKFYGQLTVNAEAKTLYYVRALTNGDYHVRGGQAVLHLRYPNDVPCVSSACGISLWRPWVAEGADDWNYHEVSCSVIPEGAGDVWGAWANSSTIGHSLDPRQASFLTPHQWPAAFWPRPAVGYEFNTYLGLPSGVPPYQITAPTDVTAIFAQLHELITNVRTDGIGNDDASGYVTHTPAKVWFDYGEEVTVKAVPYSSCCQEFSHWEGAGVTAGGDPVEGNTDEEITLSMAEWRAVTAVFHDWRRWETQGLQVFYVEPGGWDSNGYWGDKFDTLLTNPEFAGMDWDGVQIAEELCYISDTFPGNLTGDDRGTFHGDASAQFIITHEERHGVVGNWITGTGGQPDHHFKDPTGMDTVEEYYLNQQDPADVREIRAKQRYYILGWGNNDPADYNTSTLGEVTLIYRFSPIVLDACYTDATKLAHVRVEKGSVHHSCAWDSWPLWYVWSEPHSCSSTCDES